MLRRQMSVSRQSTIEGFRVPWSVRFFLRRKDPHVLSAFLKVSRLIEKPPQKKSSTTPATLTAADRELVDRIYAGGTFQNKERARLGALWPLTPRRKRGRLYAMVMISAMLQEGSPEKNALLLSKLLQLEKGFWNNTLTKLVQQLSRLLLQTFLYVALKTELLSFLFHSRRLGKLHNWVQLQENRKKMEDDSKQKLLNAFLSPFHRLIGRAVTRSHAFAIAHYASLKNPDLPYYIGGHGGLTHSDLGALVFLKKEFAVKSIVDVGCGTGGQVDAARKNGIEAFGVEGDSSLKFDKPWFFIHDFTKGHFACKRQFDLAWSVEFLEHVEEKYQPFYMSLFQRAKIAVCTAAPPGRSGYHHVNCRDLAYWIKTFKKYGFAFDAKNTEQLKKHSSMHADLLNDRGMLFVKT